jgi:hypothetical protein
MLPVSIFSVKSIRDLVIFNRTQPTSYWLQEFIMTGGLLGFFICVLIS